MHYLIGKKLIAGNGRRLSAVSRLVSGHVPEEVLPSIQDRIWKRIVELALKDKGFTKPCLPQDIIPALSLLFEWGDQTFLSQLQSDPRLPFSEEDWIILSTCYGASYFFLRTCESLHDHLETAVENCWLFTRSVLEAEAWPEDSDIARTLLDRIPIGRNGKASRKLVCEFGDVLKGLQDHFFNRIYEFGDMT